MDNATDIKDWLDCLISHQIIGKRISSFNSQIHVCGLDNNKEIHIFQGINIIADKIGCPLSINNINDKDNVYVYFNYKGYKVFQLVTRSELNELFANR